MKLDMETKTGSLAAPRSGTFAIAAATAVWRLARHAPHERCDVGC